MSTAANYQPAIGIETHVQLKTSTKLFAAVGNDARQAPPNSLISHICVGLPGALPMLNRAAIELAARAAFALGTEPQPFSKFDRKHYFYPDLPKGYQISQYDRPIIAGGQVVIELEGRNKTIGIVRAHLEEDAGKNTHPPGTNYSLVDLNRAGTPLLEIVSRPEMNSPSEAKAYARELYLLMKYAGVSEADLYHGNIRFDVNVSVSNRPGVMGTRTETKNLNSFRSVENAVTYEIKRQIELLQRGRTVMQETRGWDEAKQKTTAQRGKEEAHDYRYMPEPDIPPIVLEPAEVSALKRAFEGRKMPAQWRGLLAGLGLPTAVIETLLDAEVDEPGGRYLPLIEGLADSNDQAKSYANWIVNVELPNRRSGVITQTFSRRSRADIYKAVYELSRAGKLSSTAARSLLLELLKSGHLPPNPEKYAQEQGYLQLSDSQTLETIVAEVLAAHPSAVADVRKGRHKAIGFLVGQVMKKSLGRANPGTAQQIIKKQIGI